MMQKNCIVFVEGPCGVGKTPTVEYLSKIGFYHYNPIYIPKSLQSYEGYINWDTPYESFAEMITMTNLYDKGLNIVIDRSPLSLYIYNKEYERGLEYFKRWIGYLHNWDSAIIVCMTSNRTNLKRNVEKKNQNYKDDLSDFILMYDSVPAEFRLGHHVDNYGSNWKDVLINRVLSKTFSDWMKKIRRSENEFTY